MVRAILDGRKTQTRRIIKRGEVGRKMTGNQCLWPYEYVIGDIPGTHRPVPCPYGAPGDQLWVRETWRPGSDPEEYTCVQYQADAGVMKPDTWDEQQGFWCESVGDENAERDAKGMTPRWRPSIHMPRWASRLTLEVTAIRVERVQDITEADAMAEGFKDVVGKYARGDEARIWFAELWDIINAERGYGWAENPYVWVIEFKRAPVARGEG